MKRSTLVSLVVLAGLALIAYLVLQRPGEQSRTGEDQNHLVDYDSASVSRLEVTSANGHVVFEKIDGVWMITEPIRYPAADYLVVRAVGTGRTIALKSVVSTNPSKQGLFDVDSTGMLVRVFEGASEKAAFRVGKATTSFTETYVRAEGSDEVYIAEGTLGSIFDRKAADWRDKGIYTTPRENLTGVRFSYGDTTFSVTKHDTVWMVDDEPIGEPTSFIASLSDFDTQNFIDTVLTKLPALTAVIQVDGVVIRFHYDTPTKTYVVQKQGTDQLFSVAVWKAKQLLLRKEDFLKMKRA
jgi:hypothetical protein